MFIRTFLLAFAGIYLFGQQQPQIVVIPQTGSSTNVPPRGGVPGQAQADAQKVEKPASLQGRVANAATGEPIKRANLLLRANDSRPDTQPFSTTTDTTGAFSMTDLRPGQYRLYSDRTGYVRTEYGARGPNRPGTMISLTPGQTLTQLTVPMQPHAVIAGRIIDDDGEPVAHVNVQATTMMYRNGKRQMMPVNGGTTNDLGEYRLFGLAPGRYVISAVMRPMGMGMSWNAVDRSSGRSNEPEEGYAPTYYPGTADVSGASPVQVAAGKPVTNVDMRLRRTRTVRVSGKVVNTVAGTSGRMNPVMVMLVPRDAQFSMMFGGRNMTPVQSADGRFEMRGVTPGSYQLTAQYFEDNKRYFARQALEIGSANVENVELVIAPGTDIKGSAQVEGQVQGQSATQAQELKPGELHVMLSPTEMTMGGGAGGRVKDDGTFTLQGAGPDTYSLNLMPLPANYYVKTVRVGQQEAAEDEIKVDAGPTPPISITVSPSGGQVQGTVKTKDAPSPGVTVVLVPEVSKRGRTRLYKIGSTDQYGKFTLRGIAPGDYKPFAWDMVEPGAWQDPDFISLYESKGKTVSLKENANETAELELIGADSAQTN